MESKRKYRVTLFGAVVYESDDYLVAKAWKDTYTCWKKEHLKLEEH
jgi:hypothetical protein